MIEIRITRTDLLEAVPRNATKTPICIAMQKKSFFFFPQSIQNYMRFSYKSEDYRILYDEFIDDYLRRFDLRDPVGEATLLINDEMNAMWIKEEKEKFVFSKKIVIPVTDEHTKNALSVSPYRCTLAQAINSFPGCSSAYVCEEISFIYEHDEIIELIKCPTTTSIKEYMKSHDSGAKRKTGNLTLFPHYTSKFEETKDERPTGSPD